jgi:hypothetical protein
MAKRRDTKLYPAGLSNGAIFDMMSDSGATVSTCTANTRALLRFRDWLLEHYPDRPRAARGWLQTVADLHHDNKIDLIGTPPAELLAAVNEAMEGKAAHTGNHGEWSRFAARDDDPRGRF